MIESSAQSQDGAASPGKLVLTVSAVVAVTALALAGLMALVAQSDWWRGLLAATIISVLASGMSLVPLVWGLSRRAGMTRIVTTYFASAAIRAVVSLSGAMLAVFAGGYPPVPTLLLIVPYYFAILAAESLCVARVLWNAR